MANETSVVQPTTTRRLMAAPKEKGVSTRDCMICNCPSVEEQFNGNTLCFTLTVLSLKKNSVASKPVETKNGFGGLDSLLHATV